MKEPKWYRQLRWKKAELVANLRRADIPDRPGCYVFTIDPGPLIPASGRILYIGRSLHLKTRIGQYLVDYMQTKPTKHLGMAFIFEYRHKFGDRNLYVRWTLYGDPTGLEGSLANFLKPEIEGRSEAVILADDELLDSRYM